MLSGWLAKPARQRARYSHSPDRSPVNMRPVRLAPCAAGARPTTTTFAAGSPNPGTPDPSTPRRRRPPAWWRPPPRATRPAAGSDGTPPPPRPRRASPAARSRERHDGTASDEDEDEVGAIGHGGALYGRPPAGRPTALKVPVVSDTRGRARDERQERHESERAPRTREVRATSLVTDPARRVSSSPLVVRESAPRPLPLRPRRGRLGQTCR